MHYAAKKEQELTQVVCKFWVDKSEQHLQLHQLILHCLLVLVKISSLHTHTHVHTHTQTHTRTHTHTQTHTHTHTDTHTHARTHTHRDTLSQIAMLK